MQSETVLKEVCDKNLVEEIFKIYNLFSTKVITYTTSKHRLYCTITIQVQSKVN